MVRVWALAIAFVVAGCNGARLNPDAPGPTRSSGAPFGVDQGEVETPNSLPAGDVTRNPVTSGEGVVGVIHLPPF